MVASAGHKLGQIVGDWWEEHVVLPVLREVARDLDLFLDTRFIQRTCRGSKLLWPDSDGNHVDYDYVLELGGNTVNKGVPVAFIESFWRRGARHSKDKARDDTNKLLPMRATYPTARFLAIAACGEFTEPAREYVRSREVELFYISKSNIVRAFADANMQIDYLDNLPESEKLGLVEDLEESLDDQARKLAFENLKRVVGEGAFSSFKKRIHGSLSSMPQQIRLFLLTRTGPLEFDSTKDVRAFLEAEQDWSSSRDAHHEYVYDVVYSDGSEFQVTASNLAELRKLHEQVEMLETHMRQFA